MAKSYEELKTQVRKKFNINFDHVDFNECFTNKVEGKIFLDHYTFMRGLIEGLFFNLKIFFTALLE